MTETIPDDETFLAIATLNNPEGVEATRAGKNDCPCPNCARLRDILIRQKYADPNGAAAWPDPVMQSTTARAGISTGSWSKAPDGLFVEREGQPPDTLTKTLTAFFTDLSERYLAAEDDSEERKATPVATGVLAYFPDAIREVARVSKLGNDKHNPGEPLHWAREKSTDEADALARHLLDYLQGEDRDKTGSFHLANVAWRALALLQRFLDGEKPGR